MRRVCGTSCRRWDEVRHGAIGGTRERCDWPGFFLNAIVAVVIANEACVAMSAARQSRASLALRSRLSRRCASQCQGNEVAPLAVAAKPDNPPITRLPEFLPGAIGYRISGFQSPFPSMPGSQPVVEFAQSDLCNPKTQLPANSNNGAPYATPLAGSVPPDIPVLAIRLPEDRVTACPYG
jgi:hypothetical protein